MGLTAWERMVCSEPENQKWLDTLCISELFVQRESARKKRKKTRGKSDSKTEDPNCQHFLSTFFCSLSINLLKETHRGPNLLYLMEATCPSASRASVEAFEALWDLLWLWDWSRQSAQSTASDFMNSSIGNFTHLEFPHLPRPLGAGGLGGHTE